MGARVYDKLMSEHAADGKLIKLSFRQVVIENVSLKVRINRWNAQRFYLYFDFQSKYCRERNREREQHLGEKGNEHERVHQKGNTTSELILDNLTKEIKYMNGYSCQPQQTIHELGAFSKNTQ